MTRYVGAIDQGTTSTRFIVFDDQGRIAGHHQLEHDQIYPQPGWVEHDPAEIARRTTAVIAGGLETAGITAADLAGVGITNQRETTLVWDRETGRPLGNAIVWQDTRTADLCRALAGDHGADRFRATTGLPLATYFAGPKVRWLIDNDADVRAAADQGTAVFGTMDTWVLWNLTGRHITDVTNASRTLLMDLATLQWDGTASEAIGVPESMLPEIVPSVAVYGEGSGPLAGVPIAGALGDQQAALFGQTGFAPGRAKNTYGTGCFLLMNTGGEPVPSTSGLLTTVAYQIEGQPPAYALEGSIAIAGAGVQWLRDNLGLIEHAPDVEALARTVEDNGDVYFVPAFSGLFAPYWRDDARGVIAGLTRYADKGHLARAVLESTAYQTRDVFDAMQTDSGVDISTLFVDGGMVFNDLLMQFQADLLDVPVVRPTIAETTALGAAYAAGLAVGMWESLAELEAMWAEDRRWEPAMDPERRAALYSGWKKAVTRTFDWID